MAWIWSLNSKLDLGSLASKRWRVSLLSENVEFFVGELYEFVRGMFLEEAR